MDLLTIICLTLVIILLLQALKAQRKAAVSQRKEQRRLNNVILAKEIRITSLKYKVKDLSEQLVAKACDYATICDNLDDCLDTIQSQEALLRLKDEEIEALEKRGGMVEEATVDSCLPTPAANKLSAGDPGRRNDGRVENSGEGAAGFDKLLPNAHRELLLDEIQDHKNTKMLLELATAANLELKRQVEELEGKDRTQMTQIERIDADTDELVEECDDVLDSEIQAMEELRQDVYISEPGSAGTESRALDSVEEPEVAV